jgi:hypothetical protein
MLSIRRVSSAALAFCAALAVSAPRASANIADFGVPGIVFPVGNSPGNALAPCTSALGPEIQGGTGGTENQNCVGYGLSLTGSSVGQIAYVVGPAVGAGGLVGNSVVSAGTGIAGY